MRTEIRVIIIVFISGVGIFWLFSGALFKLLNGVVYIGWRLWLITRAFDQRLIWILFSTGVLIWLGYQAGMALKQLAAGPAIRIDPESKDSVGKWSTDVQAAFRKNNDYAKWLLAGSICGLYAQIFSERFGINQRQFKKMLENGELEFPESVRDFLKAGHRPFSALRTRSLFSGKHTRFPLDVNPELVVKHLEEFYEMDF